jgi:hypothetical protein
VRTTLTLDDDVARLIERIRKRRGATLRDVVNEALREGLARLDAPVRRRSRHATESVSLGGCLVGDVDDVADVLAVADGDGLS